MVAGLKRLNLLPVAHRQPNLVQTLKQRLERVESAVMDKMTVDIDQARASRPHHHNMPVPDLVEQGACLCHYRSRQEPAFCPGPPPPPTAILQPKPLALNLALPAGWAAYGPGNDATNR